MTRLSSLVLLTSFLVLLIKAQDNAFNSNSLADVLASANLGAPTGNVVDLKTNNPNVQATANTTGASTFGVNATNTNESTGNNPNLNVNLTNNNKSSSGSLTTVDLGKGVSNASSNASAAQISTKSGGNGSAATGVSVQQLPGGVLNVTVNVTTNGTTNGSNTSSSGSSNSNCAQNQYLDSNGNCQNCSSSCLNCVGSAGKCTSCGSNFNLVNFQCTCPSGQYQSGASCIGCGTFCTSCDGNGVCSSCHNGFSVVNGSCACPTGNYENNGNCYSCSLGELNHTSGVSTFLSACANATASTIVTTVTNRTVSGAYLGISMILLTSSAVVGLVTIVL